MKERPIILRGHEVRAILAGQMTQLRRPVDMRRIDYIGPKGCENDPRSWGYADGGGSSWLTLDQSLPDYQPGTSHQAFRIACPLGVPGDRLWVKETWCQAWDDANNCWHDPMRYHYRADEYEVRHVDTIEKSPWQSPVTMPHSASRITLEVTEVRVQRLHDISEADAIAEGIEALDGALDEVAICAAAKRMGWAVDDARSSYAVAWDMFNGKRAPFESNPFVWPTSFEVVR